MWKNLREMALGLAEEALLVLVFGCFCLLWLELVPESIGLKRKLIGMFALLAVGLCLWFWWKDRRKAARKRRPAEPED